MMILVRKMAFIVFVGAATSTAYTGEVWAFYTACAAAGTAIGMSPDRWWRD
jgi:hypothetical protein